MALLIMVLTVTPAAADFYVVAGGGRLGTAITTVPLAITSPGLYYLANNLTSSNVPTLTLSRCMPMTSPSTSMDSASPGPAKDWESTITASIVATGHTNVEIRNGSIKTFGNDGIKCAQPTLPAPVSGW